MEIRTWKCAVPALGMMLVGCASEPRTLTIEVVTGHETGAFREEPAVARIDVTATALEGDAKVSASGSPGGMLDFGEIPADQLFTFEVSGKDAAGATVVRGRSLTGIPLGALQGDVLPVFAQRLGQWARPPGALATTRVDAPGGVLNERFVLLTGGDAAGDSDTAPIDAYDLLTLGGSTSPALPRAARSLVTLGEVLLLIDDRGATWVDVAGDEVAEVALPAGLSSFAEVAGGRTLEAGDGRTFVVGATRAAPATAAVLAIGADRSLTVVRLGQERAGAAAVWVNGLGLVVAGGSAKGAGVEVLGDGATSFSPRPFPPDPVEGAAAVVTGLGEIALLGGVLAGAPAPTRRLAPTCSTSCAAAEVAGAALPAKLRDVVAFALPGPGGRMLAIGSEDGDQGLTRSFTVTLAPAQVTELPLREPRHGATAVPAPNGTLLLLGGVHPDGSPALTAEMFFPDPE